MQTLERPFCAIFCTTSSFSPISFSYCFPFRRRSISVSNCCLLPIHDELYEFLHFNISNQEYFVRKLSIFRLLTCLQLALIFYFDEERYVDTPSSVVDDCAALLLQKRQLRNGHLSVYRTELQLTFWMKWFLFRPRIAGSSSHFLL